MDKPSDNPTIENSSKIAQEAGLPPVKQRLGRMRNMPVVKPKNLKGTLLRLWSLTKGHRQGLLVVFALSGIASVSAMITPLLIGKIIDSIAKGSLSVILLTLLAFVYLGDWAIRFTQAFLMASVSQRIISFIRMELFAVMKKLPLAFFDKGQHGDYMSRLTNDIDTISTTISDSLTQLMILLFTLCGIFSIMLSLNIVLTLVVLLAIPFVFLLTKIVTSHTRKLFKKQQAALGALNGHIEETISGLSLVKAFCRENQVIEEFEKKNEELCHVGTQALIWSGYLMPIMNVINNLSFISVSVASGIMASKGLVSIGMISSFLLYSRQFNRPFIDLANIYNVFQTAVAGAERIFEIFDETPEPADPPNALPVHDSKGHIVFENVSFGYQKESPVLKNISFTAKAGERIAIVGSTGAGKTTIIHLLSRFYDVTEGRILLDGHDLREYRLKDLRKLFGVVLQDTSLFYMDIMENIRYGKKDATDQQVIAAAKASDAHSFISRLPEGYHTLIEEGGNNLSHGERQLITIARAILTQSPILILDEATSSVDTRTEQRIQKAMQKLTNGRTSFIIAHRLSTIRDADKILLLADGEITEMGTHTELMAQKGVYYAMYCTQCGLYPPPGLSKNK